MANDDVPFALSVILTVAGLGIILYGVSLNYGESLNPPMVVGGAVLLAAIGVLTRWIIAVDEAAPPDSDGHA